MKGGNSSSEDSEPSEMPSEAHCLFPLYPSIPKTNQSMSRVSRFKNAQAALTSRRIREWGNFETIVLSDVRSGGYLRVHGFALKT